MSVRAAFADQARACRALGSPLTAAVCEGLGAALNRDQGAVARRVLDWPGDATNRGDSLPLRLAGALHALVLSGRTPALAAAYAAGEADVALLLAVIADHAETVLAWLDSPPQTNEVARSAGVIAAVRFLRPALPLEVLELGASAGLNLNWPRYHLAAQRGFSTPAPPEDISGRKRGAVVLEPEWRGAAVPAPLAVDVAVAEGVDLRPVDPVRERLRLMAYCCPDQPARLARLRAALDLAARHPPRVVAGDAADWLEARLAVPAPGRLRFVFHTVAWQYFPPEVQARCDEALARAGAVADPLAPLARLAMEADGGGPGAGLTLQLWDGAARSWRLGRADFHGRWIDWRPEPAHLGAAPHPG